MQRLDYPGYGRRFMRRFVRDWVVLALLFTAAMVAKAYGYERTGKVVALIWVIAMVAELAVSWWIIFRPPCPQCGARLKSQADRISRTHVAPCASCQVEWDLGIGHDPSD